MKCPKCASDNPEKKKFCRACGEKLLSVCPRCGTENLPDDQFCGECGHTLTLAEPRAVPSSERKHVTALFSDLSGYSAMSEKLDPEEVKAIMDRIFGKIREVVARHDGTIESFMGDAVVAFLGIPHAHEDDPIRAIRAALEIHEIVRTLSPESVQRIGRPFAMHTGINTGLVVTAVAIEEGALTVAGDAVNVASRLSGIARPDEILVGESTYHQTKGTFSFEKLEPVSLKGKAEQVTPYRLLDEKPEMLRGLATQGLGSPLVGRNAEVAAIRGCVNRLLDGQGGILSVIGEAGLGKSRLMEEIRRYFESKNLLWLEGRTLSYGQKMSYWPFKEILRQYAGITEDDGDAKAWEKFETKITGLYPTGSDEILPCLASLLGLEVKGELGKNLKYLDGESMGRQVYLSSRRFFERLASTRPLVLVFEDLHWADESSTLLIEHLFPLVHRVPILLCGVSRPEVNAPAARLQETALREYERRYTDIRLNPLSPTECTQLMDNLLEIENLPGRVRQVILHKAEGNPFFLEEIMRTLIDRKAVLREGTHWRSTPAIETLTIPDTIQGVIMARIDRLDEELKAVLRTASVIGRAFLYRLLKEVAEAVRELDTHLDRLTAAELIREKQKIPELEYIFKHALVQESTYESILLQKRRELHARVASVIESLFSDRLEEFSSVLAYHYAKAEDWNKAQDYLFKAGDQAGRIAADAEALFHYEQALETYARVFGDKWDPVQRASLERKMGEAFYRRGEHPKALECLERSFSCLGKRLPGSPREIRLASLRELVIQACHRLFPQFLVKPPDRPASQAAEEEARTFDSIGWIDAISNRERFLWDCLRDLNLSEREGLPAGIVMGSSGLTHIGAALGFLRLSGRYGRMAVDAAEKAQLPDALGLAYFSLAFYELYAGKFDEAIEHGLRSADAFRKDAWNLRGWGWTVIPVCSSYLRQGNLSSAEAYAQDLVRSGQEAGHLQMACWGLAFLGCAQSMEGRFEDAIVSLKKSIELAEGIPDRLCRLVAGNFLGRWYLRQNDIDRGLITLEECEAYMAKYKMGKYIPGLATGIADAYLSAAEQGAENEKKEKLRKARDRCEQALKYGRKWPLDLAEARRLKGTCEWLREKPALAEAWWQRSLKTAEEMGMRYERGMIHLEMGGRMKDRAHLEHAEAIFAEIGAEWYLAQAQKLLQVTPETVSGHV
jgi:class 3 adenylate cyclase/tetratricopeptide (TPR) repeat protein